MRTQPMIFGTTTMAVVLAALFLTVPGRATAAIGDNAAAASPSSSPGAAGATLPSLPSGVTEVMKLFKGHIPDDIIVSYIKNSRETFYLSADNLIALQQQGVSGPVLTAMIQRYGELQRQAPMTASAPPQVQVPAQAPVPQYRAYTEEDRASANFDAALQARANAYNYAYVAPPTYPVYAPVVPVYEDPFYYDPFYYPWYPFGGVGIIDFGFSYGGGFRHGGFEHGGFGHGGFGRGGVGGGVGGRGGGGGGGRGGGGGGRR